MSSSNGGPSPADNTLMGHLRTGTPLESALGGRSRKIWLTAPGSTRSFVTRAESSPKLSGDLSSYLSSKLDSSITFSPPPLNHLPFSFFHSGVVDTAFPRLEPLPISALFPCFFSSTYRQHAGPSTDGGAIGCPASGHLARLQLLQLSLLQDHREPAHQWRHQGHFPGFHWKAGNVSEAHASRDGALC